MGYIKIVANPSCWIIGALTMEMKKGDMCGLMPPS